MGKSVHNNVLDGMLLVIKNDTTTLSVCEGEPLSYNEANDVKPAGKSLAKVGTAPTDFTIGDGDTSGRKCQVANKTGLTTDATGTADHVALLVTGTQQLSYVTTAPPVPITVGSSVDVSTWKIEVLDPV